MRGIWKRAVRLASLLLVLPLLAATCRGEVAELPLCPTTVTQEPTGDLAVDIVGAWSGTTDGESWHHPIAYMAGRIEGYDPTAKLSGPRVWMFRADGTGHVWWVLNSETGSNENDEEFDWEVVDGELMVNDFPPATVDVYSDDNFLLHPIEVTVEPEEGLVTRRCDLDVLLSLAEPRHNNLPNREP